ncbi:PrsW family intramembrane metalloprotease [Halolamina litorea]|uniref:PrsW family intramembrane metalloprotease n=1 Tax=Halolamina litorea TaxID=1515593 RepID=A0ABD6BMM9_9EURY|nr:PrsW family intramembrane metalloprotease [Halolamina litorea]
MSSDRDPVEAAADGARDLHGIATWAPRSAADRALALAYAVLHAGARIGVVVAAFSILASIGGVAAVADPRTAALAVLSAVPAVGLAAYVWYTDVTTEPLWLLVGTFLLGAITAAFAARLNSGLEPYVAGLGTLTPVLFYFLIVGPVEETVKLLAVRLLPYGSDHFSTVLDGAVYGAMAGMGFAFIENAIYIRRSLAVAELEMGLSMVAAGSAITATRAIAGPGHVIYSAFAGYYLGLAKFTPEHRGPLVLKGVLIAAFVHGLYNATIGLGPAIVGAVTGLSGLGSFLLYVAVFDGVWGLLLFRKLERYRAAYHAVGVEDNRRSTPPGQTRSDDGEESRGPSSADRTQSDDVDAAAARSRFQFGNGE